LGRGYFGGRPTPPGRPQGGGKDAEVFH
jgi:hypothetical protein